jgi:peptidoglycan-N-acetylglucosamine deacetylase
MHRPEPNGSGPRTGRSDLIGRKWHGAMVRASGALRRLPEKNRGIALTFDDGPHPVYTPPVLDALRSAGVSATFFFIGERVEAHPEIVRRAREEGHLIGSHSFSHFGPAERSVGSLVSDYRRARVVLERIIGKPCPDFRPPYGTINTANMLAMRRLGLKPWLWSAEAGDWREGASADRLLEALSDLSTSDIVLLHDGVGDHGPGISKERWATVTLIEGLVKTLTERGMKFVTLDGGDA